MPSAGLPATTRASVRELEKGLRRDRPPCATSKGTDRVVKPLVRFLRIEALTGIVTTAILAAFLIGKPVGVVLFSVLAVNLRLGARPSDLPSSLLAAGSLLSGIGFTMALFIAELAFGSDLLNAVKLGVLGASVVSAAIGLLALMALTSSGSRGSRR